MLCLTLPVSLDVPTSIADHSIGSPGFIDACVAAKRQLPGQLTSALSDLVAGNGPEVLLVRGVDVGDLPATPPQPDAIVAKDRRSEFTLLTIASAAGEPVGYLPELGGHIVQNLVPVREAAARQVSTSSAVTLAFHTETAFHPHKPRLLALLCLRGNHTAKTTFCTVSDALANLDDATKATLRQPLFRTRPDESFLREGAVAEPGPLMAVVTGPDDAPTFTFDEELMASTTTDGTRALQRLTFAVRARQHSVVLEPGDLLIIDNTRAVHGRSPFTPRYDGTDRWLQRTFIVADLAPSTLERNGRVITTQFGTARASLGYAEGVAGGRKSILRTKIPSSIDATASPIIAKS